MEVAKEEDKATAAKAEAEISAVVKVAVAASEVETEEVNVDANLLQKWCGYWQRNPQIRDKSFAPEAAPNMNSGIRCATCRRKQSAGSSARAS